MANNRLLSAAEIPGFVNILTYLLTKRAQRTQGNTKEAVFEVFFSVSSVLSVVEQLLI
jgi:hypothetical protein